MVQWNTSNDNSDLDVFDAKQDDGGKPYGASENDPHHVQQAEDQPRLEVPDLELRGTTASRADDPGSIFTPPDGLDLEEDDVEAAEPPPALNFDESDDESEDPPLHSNDLPDVSFGTSDTEPELASNDLPEVTYGASNEEPDLVSIDLPELSFDDDDDVIEAVPEQEGVEAVVFEDDDSAVVLDDDTPHDDEVEANPAPGVPDPGDGVDDPDDGASSTYSYEIAVNPLFEDLELQPLYGDDDDDTDGD